MSCKFILYYVLIMAHCSQARPAKSKKEGYYLNVRENLKKLGKTDRETVKLRESQVILICVTQSVFLLI